MWLVILLEVDVGNHLSSGWLLAGPASPEKHSWAVTIPKVIPLSETGTQSCARALFQDSKTHGWSRVKSIWAGTCICWRGWAQHRVLPLLFSQIHLLTVAKGLHLCAPSVAYSLEKKEQAFAILQPQKELNPPCNQWLSEVNLSPLWLLDLVESHQYLWSHFIFFWLFFKLGRKKIKILGPNSCCDSWEALRKHHQLKESSCKLLWVWGVYGPAVVVSLWGQIHNSTLVSLKLSTREEEKKREGGWQSRTTLPDMATDNGNEAI